MAAPASLNGAPTTITIDGVDLHLYGVTVTDVDNPLPAAVESSINLLGLDGSMDFTKNYGQRQMTITGEITADRHDLLMGYIDELNKLFRLKENADSMKVVFKDQPFRQWFCRYAGFSPKLKSLKNFGKTATFTLSLVCTKPYSEDINATYGLVRLSINKGWGITYPGTVKAPINFNILKTNDYNLLDAVLPASENPAAWTYNNATGSANSSSKIYGSNSVEVTRTAAGAFYAEIDVTQHIVSGNSFVFGGYVNPGNNVDVSFEVILEGGTNKSSGQIVTYPDTFNYAFVKIFPSDLEGVTAVKFRVYSTGVDCVSFRIDGMFAYKAQECDTIFAYGDYLPPPYKSNSTELVNPSILMLHNKNIFPWSNGDTPWESTNNATSTANDPIDTGVCMMYQSQNEDFAISPKFYVTQGKVYKISLEYLLRLNVIFGTTNKFNIDIEFYNEPGIFIGTADYGSYSNINLAWTPHLRKVTAPSGAVFGRIRLSSDDSFCKAYIRNVMVVEELESGESFDTYTKPFVQKQTYTGSVEMYDELQINNNLFTAKFADWSEKSISNGMGNFSGDKIYVIPGINMLRFLDARAVSGVYQESESTGTCAVFYSYKARYL